MWLGGLSVAAEQKEPRLETGKFTWSGRRSWSYVEVQIKGANGGQLTTVKNLECSEDVEEDACAVWQEGSVCSMGRYYVLSSCS